MNIKQEELKDRLKKALDMNEKKPADLAKDLDIPKSALSQYLSGKSKNMPSDRLYAISKYLNVSEAWIMGFDVSMERPMKQKENDELVDLINRLRKDKRFRQLVLRLSSLNPEQIEGLMKLMDFPSDS